MVWYLIEVDLNLLYNTNQWQQGGGFTPYELADTKNGYLYFTSFFDELRANDAGKL